MHPSLDHESKASQIHGDSESSVRNKKNAVFWCTLFDVFRSAQPCGYKNRRFLCIMWHHLHPQNIGEGRSGVHSLLLMINHSICESNSCRSFTTYHI